jgi:hypothetical protein
MIKTIFIPTSGSSTDHSVFATAFAVARVRHLEFREGPAINEAVEQLQHDDESLATNARRHAEEFCRANHIMLRDTATWSCSDGGGTST